MSGALAGSEAISARIATLRWSDVPADAKARAHLTFADTVGVMVAGARSGPALTVRDVLDRNAAPLRSNLAGLSEAFFLATAASALDFDDGHVRGGGIHPSGGVVAALIAAAASVEEVDAERFLSSYVVGYEVAVRAGRALYPTHANATYHCTGASGCIGAAVAVAHLEGAGADETRRALEIASAHAPMATFLLPSVKESIGWGSLTGLAAARLARGGFNKYPGGGREKGGPTVFGPPTPFDRAEPADHMLASFGVEWELTNGYHKPYPSCRFTHGPSDALIALLDREGVTGVDVDGVRVRTHAASVGLDERTPPTLEHAQYSIPFVLGAILVYGADWPRLIAEETLTDQAILARARDVTIEHAPELDHLYPQRYPAEVVVRLRDGRELTERRITVRGEPDKPLSQEEVRAKFLRCVTPTLGRSQGERLWEDCLGLEREDASRVLKRVRVACEP